MKVTRRAFIAGSLATAGAGAVAWRGCGSYDTAAFADLRVLSPRHGAILAAVVDTMLPPAAPRTPGAIAGHVRTIDAYCTGVPAADRDQLATCLTAIEQGTPVLGGHLSRFTALAPAPRAEVLTAWQTSSIGLLRLGFRALKSLVFLAYYRSADAWLAIGYGGPVLPGGNRSPDLAARYDALAAPPGTLPR